MPFRRIKRRHAAGSPVPGQTRLQGYKDPLHEMTKRKEEEESKARHRLASDFISYCFALLWTIIEAITAFFSYNILKKEENENICEKEEETSAEENNMGRREIYRKDSTVTSIVETFNSHHDENTAVNDKEGEEELMKLIENKSKSQLPSPTAELIKSVRDRKHLDRQNTDVDIQSMMYQYSS